ncbi:MAG: LVIVD repeat-containing protein [Candidatus Hodarchaeota archaeon]
MKFQRTHMCTSSIFVFILILALNCPELQFNSGLVFSSLNQKSETNTSSLIFHDNFTLPDGFFLNTSLYTIIEGDWFIKNQKLEGNWSFEEWKTCTANITFPLQDITIQFEYEVLEWYPGLSLLSFELTSDPNGRRFIDFYENGEIRYSVRVPEPEYQLGHFFSPLPTSGEVMIVIDDNTNFTIYLNGKFGGEFSIPLIQAGNIGFGVYNSHIAFDNLIIRKGLKGTVEGRTSVYEENFDSVDFMDKSSTDASGWGSGLIQSPKGANFKYEGDINPWAKPYKSFQVIDNLVFGVLPYDLNHVEFQILDTFNPSDIVEKGSCKQKISLQTSRMEIKIVENFAFISGLGTNSSMKLQAYIWVVDIQNPTSPNSVSITYLPFDKIRGFYDMIWEGGEQASISTVIWNQTLIICVSSGVYMQVFRVNISHPTQSLEPIKMTESYWWIDMVVWGKLVVWKDILCAISYAPRSLLTTRNYDYFRRGTGFLYTYNLSEGFDQFYPYAEAYFPGNHPPECFWTYDKFSFAYGLFSHDLFVRDDFLYISHDYCALQVVDLRGWPNIFVISQYEIPDFQWMAADWLHDDWNLFVDQDLVFIITSNFEIKQRYGIDLFMAINIQNPSNPIYCGTCEFPYGTEFIDIWVHENHIYLSSTIGLLVIPMSDPIPPRSITNILLNNSSKGIFIKKNLAYVVDSITGLNIVNITNPNDLRVIGSCNTVGTAHEIDLVGNYALVADGSSGVAIIDISNPYDPLYVTNYPAFDYTTDIFVKGDFAYISDNASGIYILNIADPLNPLFVGSAPTPGLAWGIYVSKSLAYIADRDAGLQIYNVSDPFNPINIGSITTYHYGNDVVVKDTYAYVATDYLGGLEIINVSDPTLPKRIGSYNTSHQSISLFLVENTVYVADGNDGIHIINVTDRTNPSLLYSHNSTGFTYDIFVLGDYAFITDDIMGLEVIEVNVNRVRQFRQVSIAQSLPIIVGSRLMTIINMTLSPTHSVLENTSIEYFISTDNGSHWESINPNINHFLLYPNRFLSWKAILRTSNKLLSPQISHISILYFYNLSSFSLHSPKTNWKTSNPRPIFTWEEVEGASNYLFQIDKDPLFGTSIDKIIGFESYSSNISLTDGSWYWRVATINSLGEIEVFTLKRVFVLDTTPPTIEHQNNVEYEQETTGHTIIWNAYDQNPSYYIIMRDCRLIENKTWDGESITLNIDGLFWGNFSFTCTVFDELGHYASDSVLVSVSPPQISKRTPLVSFLLLVLALSFSVYNKRRKISQP